MQYIRIVLDQSFRLVQIRSPLGKRTQSNACRKSQYIHQTEPRLLASQKQERLVLTCPVTQKRGLCPKKVDDMQSPQCSLVIIRIPSWERSSSIFAKFLLRDHFSWAAPGNSLQSTIVKLLLPRSGLFCAGPRLPVDPEAPMGGHGGWLRPMGVWRWRRRRKRPVPASNTKQCPAGSMAPRNAGKILHLYSSSLGLDDIQRKTKSRAKIYKFFQLTSP